jgi:hypothetical protein
LKDLTVREIKRNQKKSGGKKNYNHCKQDLILSVLIFKTYKQNEKRKEKGKMRSTKYTHFITNRTCTSVE